MGETGILDEPTDNETAPVPSEARGRAEENITRANQHTMSNIDMVTMLQQLSLIHI